MNEITFRDACDTGGFYLTAIRDMAQHAEENGGRHWTVRGFAAVMHLSLAQATYMVQIGIETGRWYFASARRLRNGAYEPRFTHDKQGEDQELRGLFCGHCRSRRFALLPPAIFFLTPASISDYVEKGGISPAGAAAKVGVSEVEGVLFFAGYRSTGKRGPPAKLYCSDRLAARRSVIRWFCGLDSGKASE